MIQIANVVLNQGSLIPIIKNVFTLGDCAPIVGTQVLSYATEVALLEVSSLHSDYPGLLTLCLSLELGCFHQRGGPRYYHRLQHQ